MWCPLSLDQAPLKAKKSPVYLKEVKSAVPFFSIPLALLGYPVSPRRVLGAQTLHTQLDSLAKLRSVPVGDWVCRETQLREMRGQEAPFCSMLQP